MSKRLFGKLKGLLHFGITANKKVRDKRFLTFNFTKNYIPLTIRKKSAIFGYYIFLFATAVFTLCRTEYIDDSESGGFCSKSSEPLGCFISP